MVATRGGRRLLRQAVHGNAVAVGTWSLMDSIWYDDYYAARSWGYTVWEAEEYADDMWSYDTDIWYW